MDEIATLNEIAPRLGVSRQAIDQALARADDRPVAVLSASNAHFYRVIEVETWWKNRADRMWKERRRRGESKSIQMNVRIGPADVERLDKRRKDGETRSAAAHRVLVAALADEVVTDYR